MFFKFIRFLCIFENRAADNERQRSFFAKFLQTAHRNDSNDASLERYRRDATFSCRILSLVPYSLRVVLKLLKYGHSVFHDTNIDVCTA